MTQPRQPQGTSSGGQFAPTAKSESLSTLHVRTQSLVFADEDGEFHLGDGIYGNPGCDSCGSGDAYVLMDGQYQCRGCTDQGRLAELEPADSRHHRLKRERLAAALRLAQAERELAAADCAVLDTAVKEYWPDAAAIWFEPDDEDPPHVRVHSIHAGDGAYLDGYSRDDDPSETFDTFTDETFASYYALRWDRREYWADSYDPEFRTDGFEILRRTI